MMATILESNLAALARHYGAAPPLTGASARSDAVRPSPEGLDAGLPTPWPGLICGIGAAVAGVFETSGDRRGHTRLLVIEPDAGVARALLERRSWVEEIDSGRFAILAGPDYAGLAAMARSWPDFSQATVVVDPNLARVRPEAEAQARTAIARLTFHQDANREARRALAGRYLVHTLGNLSMLLREGDAARLTGSFEGVPAIIAAAGPSLDRNLHDIAPALDRALVIACDTAALPLLTAGVAPHVVVAVDASEANAKHLAALPTSSMALVTEASVHPSALVPFAGRTFFFKVSNHDPWPWLVGLGLGRGHLDAWGSVATTAFALALDMGCNPIIFAGADFAFTSGRPYCRGTSYESAWAGWVAGGWTEEAVWRLMLGKWKVESAVDLHGAPTSTAPHLVAFRDWIADRAAARPDRRVVNATGAGLLAGAAIEQTTIAQALSETPAIPGFDPARTFRSRHAAPAVDHAAVWTEVSSFVAGLTPALVERWRLFSSGTLTPEALRAALASPEQKAFALGLGLSRRVARMAS